MQINILASNEDSLSERFDKTDEQISNLTEALAAEKRAIKRERFCWIVVVVVLISPMLFKEMDWCGKIIIFALELFGLMFAARVLEQEFAIKWLLDLQEKIKFPFLGKNKE